MGVPGPVDSAGLPRGLSEFLSGLGQFEDVPEHPFFNGHDAETGLANERHVLRHGVGFQRG